MLALPVAVGWILRFQEGAPAAPELLLVVGCWVFGYLAFNAAAAWLKAPARRRPAARPPLLAWSSLTIGFGAAALVAVGPGLLGWGIAFGPLVTAALWLASLRRERSLLGGALTVAAASLMTLVTRFIVPGEFLSAWATPSGATALVHTWFVFGYLFGTVFFVKTMIRERGHQGWLAASIGWHVALLVVAVWLAGTRGVGLAWPVLFGATLGRAWLLPRLAARRSVRPLAIGLVEITNTLAFVAVTAWG
jgi:hypothetical protein